ncbi:hypothetical protein HZV21_005073 [Salmonella enterica]|nr:hypothetical protein [Salmonella enterica]EFQ8337977.1 hypothetical protein [Salmonella enterica]
MSRVSVWARSVFPASAGINRPSHHLPGKLSGVPRVSGDKPQQITKKLQLQPCSPRQRG